MHARITIICPDMTDFIFIVSSHLLDISGYSLDISGYSLGVFGVPRVCKDVPWLMFSYVVTRHHKLLSTCDISQSSGCYDVSSLHISSVR